VRAGGACYVGGGSGAHAATTTPTPTTTTIILSTSIPTTITPITRVQSEVVERRRFL
jgi:hypothetical protein